MISWLLETLGRIKYSPKSSFIRKFTNLLYYDPKKMILDINKVGVIEVGGCKFYANEALEGLVDMTDNPWLGGTRPTDVVLDLGAHVGIMCIPLAKKVKKVYAIEPLYVEELRANLELNGLDNVLTWGIALGNGRDIKLRYHERKRIVPTLTFKEIRNLTGPVDFLKCNCEGGEWLIKPEELQGIREIRLDYHIGRTKVKERHMETEAFVNWLSSNSYLVDVRYLSLGLHPQHKGFYKIMASRK